MDTKQALNILITAVRQANLKGVYTLEDSAVIAEAVSLFTNPKESGKNTPEAPKEEKPKKK